MSGTKKLKELSLGRSADPPIRANPKRQLEDGGFRAPMDGIVRPTFNLDRFIATRTMSVNQALNRYLPRATTKPATIHRAMRYSLFAGGKRMRPALCLAAAAACGGNETDALPLACAIECIHTYSLVHDDLPAMDNDDYRRARAPRPTRFW